jgi:hypothetical protein
LRQVDEFAFMADNAVVFDIGSKDTPMVLPRGVRRVTVDVDPRVKPDILADAHDMHMIPSESADGVVVISVLHHCRKPWLVVQEIHRIRSSCTSTPCSSRSATGRSTASTWTSFAGSLAKHPAAHVIHTGTYFLGGKAGRV